MKRAKRNKTVKTDLRFAYQKYNKNGDILAMSPFLFITFTAIISFCILETVLILEPI
jgi:hypothetical protein